MKQNYPAIDETKNYLNFDSGQPVRSKFASSISDNDLFIITITPKAGTP